MIMWRRVLTVLILYGLAGLGFAGYAQETSPEQVPTIRTTTREVILDVVVRDKHHHAVADLSPDEIEVLEDGVQQKINAFHNVQGAEQLQTEQALVKSAPAAGAPAAAPQGSATTLRELNFVSVVFAQIAPLNLEFAREAVLEFLKSDTLPNTYVTIYRLDRNLSLVQQYTADKTSLMKALDAAAKGVNSKNDFGPSATIASGINATIQASGTNIIASPFTSSQTATAVEDAMLNPLPGIATDPLWARNASSQDASVTLGNALLAQAAMVTGLRFADNISSGMDAMDALRQLVRVQAKLPGRKVVLYLADGLTLPMDRRDVVNSVISYANQMEVSFYAVDTRGLSTDDPLAQSLADQARAAAESSVNKVSPRMGHLEGDDVELSTISNQQLAMEELAESTGGFAVTNTNQIALPMQRVMEDIRTHYEIAYTPLNTNYDGHFRRIEVRIARPHVSVQTRSGYFALPEVNGEPLQPFEMTALHAINTRPAPKEFPYQASLLRFRPRGTSVDYEMAFDVPISSLQVVTNAKDGEGRIRASLVALIHKSDGEVVGKVSRDLVRTVPKQELSRLSGDYILYAEPVELPGGHYLIDTAVTDELAGKTTVKRMAVFVDSSKNFGVSSLELVRSVKPLPGERDNQDPFETDSGRVVPTLSESMPPDKPIGVYFVVYPMTSSVLDPTITLQLFRDGQRVGQQTLASWKRQADGSIPILLQLRPEPGQCDMVVTAQQGTMKSEATLSVKIAPGGAATPN
jgi:VWFA-related protein